MILTATIFLVIVFGLGIVGSCMQLTSKKPTTSAGFSLTNIFISILAIIAVLYLASH